MTADFVHLHVHTQYSVRDSICRIKPLLQAAAEDKMPAVAITDLENIFGGVKFYKAALNAGIKPIIGAQLQLQSDLGFFSVVCLCMSTCGYLNLTRLITMGQAQFTARPALPLQSLLTADCSDLIMIVLDRSELLKSASAAKDSAILDVVFNPLMTVFKDRLYFSLARLGRRDEAELERQQVQLAERYSAPLVAVNAVCFMKKEDFQAHEARVCIDRSETLDQPRSKDYTPSQYFRTAAEMQQLFSDHPEALANTIAIAKRCNFQFEFGVNHLPDFPIEEGKNLDEFFKEKVHSGLERRFSSELSYVPDTERVAYWQRLEEECAVIIRMAFPGYFLIVADFIRWALEHAIPVGPGRGSGAGSLVAYSLGITGLDPIKYDLLFERFLNPERVSLPDFDIDFCMDNRDRVIDYVMKKYGTDRVSQIITFGTMAAKAVVRDVGRVLGHPYGFVDKIAKLIPMDLGITLKKALAQEPALLERYRNDPEVNHLLSLAMKLEGIIRQVGRHAGGVVISPRPLVDFMPLYLEQGQGAVSQLDKDDLEEIGLLKFDFLGLRTLTIIDWTVRAIKKAGLEQVNMSTIPLDDRDTFKLLQNGQSTAVFQLESRGMKDLIKRLQPDCFEDIVSLVALFRPGPLQSGMVDDFIARKHGKEPIVYLHPSLEPILKPTYGVILYQEQVMQIAQVLSGYTLGGADLLRRAMGKKKPQEMAKQRSIFIAGAEQNGVTRNLSGAIFDVIEKFAGYGFNRSHSVAYAMLSYQTAWLKTHFMSYFMAAVLSSDMDNTDKVINFLDECECLGIEVLSPNVRESFYGFTVGDQGKIIYGLGAIKGIGQAAVETLIKAREARDGLESLVCICEALAEHGRLNKRLLEALCQAGALDCFDVPRASIFSSIEKAVVQADRQLKDRATGQRNMFSMLSVGQDLDFEYVVVKPWNEERRLQGEKDCLGYYLSGHPMDKVQRALLALGIRGCSDLQIGQIVRCVGLVVSVRIIQSKAGRPMAFLSLEDKRGQIDVAVFGKLVEASRHHLVKEAQLVVTGEVSFDDFSGGLRLQASHINSVLEVQIEQACVISLSVSAATMPTDAGQQIRSILDEASEGDVRVMVEFLGEAGCTGATILAGKSFQLAITGYFLERLASLPWLKYQLGYDIPEVCQSKT